MARCIDWPKTTSKQNFLDCLKFEVDNKSSVVLSIQPDLIFNPEDIDKTGHCFVVMDYNLEHKAIKLYNPNFCNYEIKDLCLTTFERADPNKGELWVTLDQLEKRFISIFSLHLKNMYKSVFKIYKTLKPAPFALLLKKYSKVKFSCKVDIKEASTFMINLFLFNDKSKRIKFCVFTDDSVRRKVKLSYNIQKQLLYQHKPKNV